MSKDCDELFDYTLDFFSQRKERGDFLANFKEKAGKKNAKWQRVYKHFEKFTRGRCSFGEVNVDLCRRFMEYLHTAKQYLPGNLPLHINTVAAYWSTNYSL